MVFTSPRLTAGERARLYGGTYFQSGAGDSGYVDYIGEAPLHLLTAWRRLHEIERRHAPGALLEIGCAAGFTLVLARGRGWTVRGIEASETMARFARERFGLDVRCASVEEVALEGQHDVVLLDDTLEHLGSPRLVVRRLREHLGPGGMLALKTPNVGSLSRRLLGRRWFHFKPDEHLHFFDPGTIRCLLEEEGYEHVEVRIAERMISAAYLLGRLGLRRGPMGAPRAVFPVWTGEMAIYAWSGPPNARAGDP